VHWLHVRDSPVSIQGSPLLSASTTGVGALGDAVVSEGIALSSPNLVLALYCYTVRIVAPTHYSQTTCPGLAEGQTMYLWLYSRFMNMKSLSQKWHTWQVSNQHASFTELETSPNVLPARSCTNSWNTTQYVIIRHCVQVYTYDTLHKNCTHCVNTIRVTIIDATDETKSFVGNPTNSIKWGANSKYPIHLQNGDH
jgi:hypothetical protein